MPEANMDFYAFCQEEGRRMQVSLIKRNKETGAMRLVPSGYYRTISIPMSDPIDFIRQLCGEIPEGSRFSEKTGVGAD